MESPWNKGTNFYANSPGPMTKMATMPIYGTNLKQSSFPEPKTLMTLKLSMQHRVLKCYQSSSNDDPWLTLTYFTARSNSETIVVCELKLATDDQSDKKFLLTSKLCPLAAVCPLPRDYIHVLNHEKKLYKIRPERFLWNLQQMGKG